MVIGRRGARDSFGRRVSTEQLETRHRRRGSGKEVHSRRKSQAYYTDAYPPAYPSSFPSPLTSLLQIHSKQWRCSVTKHSCLPTYPSKPMSTIQTRANVIHSKTSRNTCRVTVQEYSATFGPHLSILDVFHQKPLLQAACMVFRMRGRRGSPLSAAVFM